MNEAARPDEWVNELRETEKLELYVEVAGAMMQTARKGIRRMIRRPPSEHDVEDVVLQAFNKLWSIDREQVRSVKSMGCKIAYRKGQDRGRRILQEQRRLAPTDAEYLADHPPLDVVDETRFAALTAILSKCMEHLTSDQHTVISATVAGCLGEEPVDLAEWVRMPANETTKTYEAWRRQRKRGLASLRRCVEGEQVTVGGLDD